MVEGSRLVFKLFCEKLKSFNFDFKCFLLFLCVSSANFLGPGRHGMFWQSVKPEVMIRK